MPLPPWFQVEPEDIVAEYSGKVGGGGRQGFISWHLHIEDRRTSMILLVKSTHFALKQWEQKAGFRDSWLQALDQFLNY